MKRGSKKEELRRRERKFEVKDGLCFLFFFSSSSYFSLSQLVHSKSSQSIVHHLLSSFHGTLFERSFPLPFLLFLTLTPLLLSLSLSLSSLQRMSTNPIIKPNKTNNTSSKSPRSALAAQPQPQLEITPTHQPISTTTTRSNKKRVNYQEEQGSSSAVEEEEEEGSVEDDEDGGSSIGDEEDENTPNGSDDDDDNE